VATQKDNGNNYTRTEDNYKHIFERYLGFYISNGAFIQAAVDEGFTVIENTPECLL
jgi:hypothetical protein